MNGVKYLSKSLKQPRTKHLVFTSAGDNSNLSHWLKGTKDFDLWINYFGEQQDKFRDSADYYMMRKGGKFPNLHFSFQNWPNIFKQYDSIFILDDDLIFSGGDISKLFKILELEKLWLLQPAFDRRGKVSFQLNQVRPFSKLRFTNFVEVTCPLLTTDKLVEFMKVYDPRLVGWGVDLWFSELLSIQDRDKNRIAIIDEVSCINPLDRTKFEQEREIDKLQSTEKRKECWAAIQKQYKLNVKFEKHEFSQIKAKLSIKSVSDSIKITILNFAYNCYKCVQGDTWRPH